MLHLTIIIIGYIFTTILTFKYIKIMANRPRILSNILVSSSKLSLRIGKRVPILKTNIKKKVTLTKGTYLNTLDYEHESN